MPQQHSSSPIVLLRAALASERFPEIRRKAVQLIRRALKSPTIGEAAQQLGVGRRAFEKLRADWPELTRGR